VNWIVFPDMRIGTGWKFSPDLHLLRCGDGWRSDEGAEGTASRSIAVLFPGRFGVADS
jgi:hypothetical protein